MARMSGLMASFRNNIADFNKNILSIWNALWERGEDPGNLLLQILATYADSSPDNGPFTHYIEILEN